MNTPTELRPSKVPRNCICCRKKRMLNAAGWCDPCVQEEREIKALRNRVECVEGLCSTPETCARNKCCAKDD